MGMPTTKATSQPGDEAAVKAALKKYNDAVNAGDVAVLKDFIAATSEGQKKALELMARLTGSGRAVYNATLEKFGEKALTEANVERRSFPGGFPPMPVEQMTIKPEGDTASLVIGGPEGPSGPPLTMRRTAGTWKIDGDALLPPLTDKQIKDQTSILEAAMKAIDDTGADVKAGHIKAADEVVVLMNHRVQKAVQAAQMKLAPMEDPAMMPPAGPPSSMPATGPSTMPMQ